MLNQSVIDTLTTGQDLCVSMYDFFQNEDLSTQEIQEFLTHLSEDSRVNWHLVGNYIQDDPRRLNNNNMGSVEKNANKHNIITELIVNQKDAVMILDWILAGATLEDSLLNQTQFVQKYYGIDPQTRLSGKSQAKINRLAEKVGEVRLRKNFNFDFRDNGVGVLPDDFETSLVSLGHGNKASLHFVTGAYGLGAGSSFAKNFCSCTFIASKRHDTDRIGFTVIVYKRERDDANYLYTPKCGSYYYLSIDGEIPEIQHSLFTYGTLRRHFDVQMRDEMSANHSGPRSPYSTARYQMPTTVLPFYQINDFADQRSENKRGVRNPIIGILDALVNAYNEKTGERTRTDKILYTNNIRRAIPQLKGDILISYFLTGYHEPDKKGKQPSRLKAYVNPLKPIIFAAVGQSRGFAGANVISNSTVSNLDQHLAVIVALDGLDKELVRDVLISNRESINEQYARMFNGIVRETLESDPVLQSFNQEFQEYQFGQENKVHDTQHKQFLAKFFKHLNLDIVTDMIYVGPAGPPHVEISQLDIIDCQEPPTIFDFIRKKEVQLSQGRATGITCITDATSNPKEYINAAFTEDNRITAKVVPEAPSKISYAIECKVGEIDEYGRFMVFLKAPSKKHNILDRGKIIISITPKKPGGIQGDGMLRTVSREIPYVIVEYVPKPPTDRYTLPNIVPVQVDPDSEDVHQMNMWETMTSAPCFADKSAGDLRKEVSYFIPAADIRSKEIRVFYNIKNPSYTTFVSRYEAHRYHSKKRQFETMIYDEIYLTGIMHFLNPYFKRPGIEASDCEKESSSVMYWLYNNNFLNMCHRTYMAIEDKKKKTKVKE